MQSVVSSIPVLKLSKNVIQNMLLTCGTREILTFSTLSNRSKSLAESLNLYAAQIRVYIGHAVKLEVIHSSERVTLTFYNNNEDFKIVLGIPEEITVDFESSETWRNRGWTINDWSNHLVNVFGWPSLDFVCFEPGFEKYDLESIQKNFRVFRTLTISPRISNELTVMLLENMLLPAHVLALQKNPYEKRLHLDKIFLQNLTHLSFKSVDNNTEFTLDDVLMSNIQFLFLSAKFLPENDVNKLLKLWRRGMNSKLSYIEFIYPADKIINRAQVLKSIEFTEIPDDVERRIPCFDSEEEVSILGGCDFYGQNGKKGTIIFETNCIMYFLVWE
ncbi:hypothetical protein CAEBREN_22947 [Caenorhabditis brenneri]|uniref:Sdz-33 F-box domain-containing protein n=1 Tax=Caenorhabditis brenneri TaxID=135651 RepID=G0MC60_CAEBE|nr:hypothetical protein CAEBREN_22947 [Caenorhabditis brenneri]